MVVTLYPELLTTTCVDNRVAATDRLNEVDSVFEVSSRINSTWGGNLVDMVRSERYIQLITEHQLLDSVKEVGDYALERLTDLAAAHPDVDNVRGRGLMCAFDLPNDAVRERVRQNLLSEQKVIMLASGQRSLRFRPVLDFTRAHVDEAVTRIDRALQST